MDVRPLTPQRLDDLAELFGSNGTTTGCYCMYFLLVGREFQAGWRGGNRAAFEAFVTVSDLPTGLLAYDHGEPVGWCAAGPRSRYSRVFRSPLWKDRDVDEDDSFWLVPCFFVRRSARGHGITRVLLSAAVELAAAHGAAGIEGFPRSGHAQVDAASAYLGTEPLFESCGFAAARRPSDKRVMMRLTFGA